MKILLLFMATTFSLSSFACDLSFNTSAVAEWSMNAKTKIGKLSIYHRGIEINGKTEGCTVEQQILTSKAVFSSSGVHIQDKAQQFSSIKEDSAQEIQSIYGEAVNEMLQKDLPQASGLEFESKASSVVCQKVKKEMVCKADLKTEGDFKLK